MSAWSRHFCTATELKVRAITAACRAKYYNCSKKTKTKKATKTRSWGLTKTTERHFTVSQFCRKRPWKNTVQVNKGILPHTTLYALEKCPLFILHYYDIKKTTRTFHQTHIFRMNPECRRAVNCAASCQMTFVQTILPYYIVIIYVGYSKLYSPII